MSRPVQRFLPGEGIAREVITADIQRYLGPDALVRPGIGIDEHRDRAGYWITAHRSLTTLMIEDLLHDTLRWLNEKSEAAKAVISTGLMYQDSETHATRQHWGPTDPAAVARGNNASNAPQHTPHTASYLGQFGNSGTKSQTSVNAISPNLLSSMRPIDVVPRPGIPAFRARYSSRRASTSDFERTDSRLLARESYGRLNGSNQDLHRPLKRSKKERYDRNVQKSTETINRDDWYGMPMSGVDNSLDLTSGVETTASFTPEHYSQTSSSGTSAEAGFGKRTHDSSFTRTDKRFRLTPVSDLIPRFNPEQQGHLRKWKTSAGETNVDVAWRCGWQTGAEEPLLPQP
ncbi:hypothetical protein BDV96DRAFT_663216 [Lophiotrema nucula]|uniref:Uncharacterized protein n=1 Tax=Lophiotrema nucula TaxID=690887 RepID=A0A6A5ZRB6_9PLEO|nr:hypothetical protein BDV96DRAFT_663216 [Lophiotrema nucula]